MAGTVNEPPTPTAGLAGGQRELVRHGLAAESVIVSSGKAIFLQMDRGPVAHEAKLREDPLSTSEQVW